MASAAPKAATIGKQAKTDLPAAVFAEPYNESLVHEAARADMNARRQGTHSSLTRGEVAMTGAKAWRQKGTGRARAGSIRSPLWSGGGVVFGPKPRDYSKKINAKVKQLAFSRALFDRANAGELAVIEQFDPAAKKTKAVNAVVGRIAPKGRVLLVDAPFSAEASRAARNIERVSLQEAAKLNTHDLCQYQKIVVSTKALEAIIARVELGYSYEDLAKALQKPTAEAARKHAQRALVRLAEAMKVSR